MFEQDFFEKYSIDFNPNDYEENSHKTVVCGMSGGVDSSVSALILKKMGFIVRGIFMRNWEEIDEHGKCSAEVDYKDVVDVCEDLEIPYFSLDFSEEYKNQVFEYFLEEYKNGHTPNPDILCNREIKFKVFYNKAFELGADFLATGHYCKTDGKSLFKGKDASKDQSYFLYAINGDVLKNTLFPIGNLKKTMVRKIASDYNLITKHKKDSTGICFIGERNFKEFLSQYISSKSGDFVHLETNKVLKSHDGSCFYTKGQRKGLGIGGPGGPFFVVKKDTLNNIVYVCEGENHPALYARELVASDINWIDTEIEKIHFPLKCKAKIRYRQMEQNCTVYKLDNSLKVIFNEPQRAITERQSIVFYLDDKCIGGAVIAEVGISLYDESLITNNENHLDPSYSSL